MLKARITLAVAAMTALSLTGCATQAQLDEQNKQLAAIDASLAQIHATLTQIHATQFEALALQKVQTKIGMETHNLQNEQSKRK